MFEKPKVVATLEVANAALSDVFSDMARVHLDHRPFAKAGKVIVLRVGNRKAYAVARGTARGGRGIISLDSATREKLDVKAGQIVELTIQKAGFCDEFAWAWGATDAMPRVAARLGAISVVLGAIGLVLGIISLCKS